MSSPLVFESLQNDICFPPLKISNSFGSVDYDAHINTKVEYPIKIVFKSLTIPETNTIHHNCELERTQLLTILAMSVQNPQLAGYL